MHITPRLLREHIEPTSLALPYGIQVAEPVLRTERLTRDAGARRLVDGVSIAVSAGELLVIVGASGAGKSSLLRLINRLDEPTSGTAYLEGRDYREIPARELRRRAGMVMQRPYLFPGTVAANIRFGPEQRGAALDDDAVEQLLRSVGLSGFAARDVANLSGGEAQTVAVARTLANQPAVLLMDEPTSAVDEEMKRQIELMVVALTRERGLATAFVTHDLAQAARIADRVARMESGRITASGTPAEVLC